MQLAKYWPPEVQKQQEQSPSTIEVLLYAQVSHPATCPKRLLTQGIVHRHKSNTTMLFCFRDTKSKNNCRLMMCCFLDTTRSIIHKKSKEPIN